MQPPTATSLLGLANAANAAYTQTMSNPLLQALISQQTAAAVTPAVPAAPVAAAAPAAPAAPAAAPATPAAPANASGAINQLAQLLQGRGIDPNTLSALLKQDQDSSRQQAAPAKSSANGGYSTSYPATSAYDLYYGQQSNSSYGPTKDDESKRGYRPY